MRPVYNSLLIITSCSFARELKGALSSLVMYKKIIQKKMLITPNDGPNFETLDASASKLR